MEEKRLSWSDRLVAPVVRLIPKGVQPNHLSMARAAMVVPVAAALLHNLNVIAVILLIVAVGLDILDGAMARIKGQESQSGEWVDAYADKMLIVGILLLYGWSHFPVGLILAVVITELCLIVGRPLKIKWSRSGKANIFGKIKMWCQSAAIIGLAAGATWALFAANILLWAALGFAVLSLARHIRDIFKRM